MNQLSDTSPTQVRLKARLAMFAVGPGKLFAGLVHGHILVVGVVDRESQVTEQSSRGPDLECAAYGVVDVLKHTGIDSTSISDQSIRT